MKKLNIDRETLRRLTGSELDLVVGGKPQIPLSDSQRGNTACCDKSIVPGVCGPL